MKKLRVLLCVAKLAVELILIVLLTLYIKEYRENALSEIGEGQEADNGCLS